MKSLLARAFVLIALSSAALADVPFFRHDYTYYLEAQGWLKMQMGPLRWTDARSKCFGEGAVLASPLNEGLYAVMKNILAMWSPTAFIGMHRFYATEDFVSIEGKLLANMSAKWGRNEPDYEENDESCLTIEGTKGALADVSCKSRHRFMCYKKHTGPVALNECGNSAKGYRLDKRTGSCYKFHPEHSNWYRAHATCSSEGGHLAVINSHTEVNVIEEIFKNNPGATFVFLGFYNWAGITQKMYWVTVNGKTLEEAGFNRWDKNEPNSLGGAENCGTLKRGTGSLNDAACISLRPFICEIERPKI